jgi:DNA-binding CsgD family transcriptional regulator
LEAESPEILLARVIKSLNTDRFADDLNRWLRTITNHDNTTILAYFQDQTPRLLMADAITPDVHRHMKNVYLVGAYLLDPFYEVHRSRKAADMYRIWDIAPDQFSRNQYFIEYYRRTTMIDEIGFVVWPSPQTSIHVCLGRDVRSDQRFLKRERSAAKGIFPIVEALVCSHWANLQFGSDTGNESVIHRMVRLVAHTHGINLTNRQAEVALLVLQGHSSNSIGLRLGISPQTVKVFRKQLYKRCEVSSQAELFGLMLPMLSSQNETLAF